MKFRLEVTRVRSRIKDIRRKIFFTQQEIRRICTELDEKLTNVEYKWLEEVIKRSENKEDRTIKKRQIRKHESLIEEKRKMEEKQNETLKDQQRMKETKIGVEVIDLTIDGIDEEVKRYLALGPDFCEAPRRVPYEEIISETEKICSIIKEGEIRETAEEEIELEVSQVRDKVKTVIKKAVNKKFRSNLPREERVGKTKALKDKDRIYLPADKGRIMVAMDRWESEGGKGSYEFKMKQVLADLKAKPSIRAGKDWDLTGKVCRDGANIINDIVQRNELSKEEGDDLKPKNCHAPRLSGLPKIHKHGIPLRGIVSTVGTPFEKISRYLIPILRTIQGRSGLFVKNSSFR